MTDNIFCDSNIWLYSFIKTPGEEAKHDLAKDIIRGGNNLHASTQVVNEVCVNLIRKAGKDNQYILQFTRDFIAAYPIHAQTTEDILTAATLRLDYHLSYWDSLIVAAAINADCRVLYSEDMQHGLCIYETLDIINPFHKDIDSSD